MQIKEFFRWMPALTVLVILAAVLRFGGTTAEANNLQGTRPTSAAVVDINRLLESLDETEKLTKKLEDRVKKAQASIDSMMLQAEEIADELKFLEPGSAQFEAKRDQGIQNEVLMEATRQAFELVITKQQRSDEFAMFNKVMDAVARLAERDGYDLVLVDDRASRDLPVMNLTKGDIDRGRSQIASQRVLFAHEQIDLTDALIRMMNNEFNK